MNDSRCPRCGVEFEASNLYSFGITILLVTGVVQFGSWGMMFAMYGSLLGLALQTIFSNYVDALIVPLKKVE